MTRAWLLCLDSIGQIESWTCFHGISHMFGYMIADIPALSEEAKKRYRGCYCGICRSIGRRCGTLCRCCLTYDMVFLMLTLNALYEPEESEEAGACPIHPLTGRRSWHSEVSGYAADLNVLLARLNALDDWQDDRAPLKWAEAKLLEKGAAEAAERNPRQWAAIRESMAFIYLLDAVTDLKKDERRGLYNPVAAMAAEGATDGDLREILLGLMGEAAAAWERLPLLRDAEIQRSILYAGIWKQLPAMK